MADISSMTLLNGDVVNLKDSAAREAASSAASGLTGKVDKAQGVQNTGKILKVGSSGVLELVDPASGSGDVVGPNSATDDHVATFDGTTGKLIQDSGFTIGASVPANAVFTDTTYNSLEPEVGGTDESLVTTGEKAVWNAKADISDIPDVSSKADLVDGKVPSSQLPSYVDDVLEYADLQHFPLTGESGKIYIAQDTNKTYRWSGSTYAEISESLALGETSSTAYRGDYGAEAYAAAVTNVDTTPTVNSTHLVTSGGVAAAIPDISGKVNISQGSQNAGKILGINAQGNVEPVVNTGGSDMTGATASADGARGLVPAPLAGDQDKVLSGGGTWEYMSAASKEFTLDNVLNTSGVYSHTTTLADVTSDMKPIKIELGTPSAFNDRISVTCNDGSITLTCDDVAGSSTVKVTVLKQANTSGTVTSDEFDTLAGRIGTLSSLTTTEKTSTVAAINSLNNKFRCGSFTITFSGEAEVIDGVVSFSPAYPSNVIPIVVASLSDYARGSTGSAPKTSIGINGTSNNGFTYKVKTASITAGNVTCYWIAMIP